MSFKQILGSETYGLMRLFGSRDHVKNSIGRYLLERLYTFPGSYHDAGPVRTFQTVSDPAPAHNQTGKYFTETALSDLV